MRSVDDWADLQAQSEELDAKVCIYVCVCAYAHTFVYIMFMFMYVTEEGSVDDWADLQAQSEELDAKICVCMCAYICIHTCIPVDTSIVQKYIHAHMLTYMHIRVFYDEYFRCVTGKAHTHTYGYMLFPLSISVV